VKKSSAALTVLLAAASVTAARAQIFAGSEDLAGQLALVQARASAQRAIPQAPPVRAMGETVRAAAEQVGADAVPDVTSYQVRGMDISHHQNDLGAIDWAQVRLDGLSFVYIKATEGGDVADADFTANWEGSGSAGLAHGAYHFYNFCRSGASQADNVLRTVPAEAGALPLTIDLEASGDCEKTPAKAAFRKDLAVFIAKVTAAYGRAPILYLNYAIYDRYFKGDKVPYKLWIADPKRAPALPDGAAWTLWQYNWHGKAAGIDGEVDLDVFNGTPEMFAALRASKDVLVALP